MNDLDRKVKAAELCQLQLLILFAIARRLIWLDTRRPPGWKHNPNVVGCAGDS